MPRRYRPPATAREIAAYLAGSRLWAEWVTHWADQARMANPTREWAILRLARQDAEVLASMDERKFWYYFWAGWAEAER